MPSVFTYSVFFLLATLLTFLITPLVIVFAQRKTIVAKSRFGDPGEKRIALLGGVSIYSAFFIIVIASMFLVSTEGVIISKHLFGILLGGFFLIVGGFLDDRYNLPPLFQFVWPVLGALTIIASGIGIPYITNPISPDELIYLNIYHVPLLTVQGIPYHVTLPADLISFIWLIGIMYATKLQDGLDGLVSGISFIATLFIFMLSYFLFEQFDLAYYSFLFAGILFAFLYYNRYPAKIYLGEGGSLFTGFVLGSFAILSDAKVIITLILFAIPIMDAAWTVIRRLRQGQKPWIGDSEHLHHRLIKKGYSQKQAVRILYSITALFGMFVFLWQSSFTYYFYGVALLTIMISALFFRWVYTGKKGIN